MKRILHFFRTSQFNENYINMINEFFPHEMNTFWVYWVQGGYFFDYENRRYLQHENVELIPEIAIKLNKENAEKLINEFDIIIYHGFFEPEIIEWFYNHKRLLKKLYLFVWGGDKYLLGNSKEKRMKKYVVKNASKILTIMQDDYDYVRKIYHCKGKRAFAMYGGVIETVEKKRKIKKDKTVNIQVGNSATQTNNHIRVLEELKKFKDEDIKIFSPLSYGDMNYATEVIQYAKGIFGSKFVPIQRYMPLEEYGDFLCNMDIAIFDVEGRQQALGNIFGQLKQGCKLYFRGESVLYRYLINDLNCRVNSIESIHDMTFEEFIFNSQQNKEHNSNQIQNYNNIEACANAWKMVFEG